MRVSNWGFFVFFNKQNNLWLNVKKKDAYFPRSAVMYSSQEIVLGAGAVSDCLLAGWARGNTSQKHIYSPRGAITV